VTDKVSVDEMEAELEFRVKDAKTSVGRNLYLAILSCIRASQSPERVALDRECIAWINGDDANNLIDAVEAHGRALLGGRDG